MDFIAALASNVVESTPIVLPLISPDCAQPFEHPTKHLLVRLCVDEPSGARNGDVIGSVLIQADGKEMAQRERIGQSPGDAPFPVEAFEEPDRHDAEVLARRQGWPSEFAVIKTRALSFTEEIEPGGVQHFVEALVERVSGSPGEFAAVPEVFLPLSLLAGAHRHTSILGLKQFVFQCFATLDTGC